MTFCILCDKPVGRRHGTERHVHTMCLNAVEDELYGLRKQRRDSMRAKRLVSDQDVSYGTMMKRPRGWKWKGTSFQPIDSRYEP